MTSLLMIMVDALRYDYVRADTTPFLHELAGDGTLVELVPPFGFEPDEAIFTGRTPAESDAGTQYWLDPRNSPFRFVPPTLGALVDRLPRSAQLGGRALVMLIVRLTARSARIRDHPTTARIPFRYLRYFDFVQKRYPFEPGYPAGDSLFREAEARGLDWFFHGFPRDDVSGDRVLEAARREVDERMRFLYFHIGDLDRVGHEHGPNSREIASALLRTDAVIGEVVDTLERKLGSVQLMIFGDHGMCEVHTHIDVRRRLRELSSRPGHDYLYFLDSTLVRFWCRTPGVEEKILETMEPVDGLRLIGPDLREALEIDYPHNRFGDLIYQVEEGYIIHPSFYSDGRAPLGMHGYGPEARGDRTLLILRSAEMDPLIGSVPNIHEQQSFPMRIVHDVASAALRRSHETA